MGTVEMPMRSVPAANKQAEVLFGIDLAVRPGEVVALLGRNGAGKSTLIKAVMGAMPRAAGEIEFDGIALLKLPSSRIARLGIGYVPEDRRIFGNLTVLENLEAGRQLPRPGIPEWTPESFLRCFPTWASAAWRWAARCRAASSRCWRSRAR